MNRIIEEYSDYFPLGAMGTTPHLSFDGAGGFGYGSRVAWYLHPAGIRAVVLFKANGQRSPAITAELVWFNRTRQE